MNIKKYRIYMTMDLDIYMDEIKILKTEYRTYLSSMIDQDGSLAMEVMKRISTGRKVC